MATSYIPSLQELETLYSDYLKFSSATPTESWNQITYDRLVTGLLHHAPIFLENFSGNNSFWMETFSGCKFNISDEDPKFKLEDLVWGCARIPRYNGQFKGTVSHYSVAEHIVLLTRWLLEQTPESLGLSKKEWWEAVRALAGHDLQEGLLGDMVTPVKRKDPFYTKIENWFCEILSKKYDLKYPLPPIVKELDYRILADEKFHLMTDHGNVWFSGRPPVPLGVTFKLWNSQQAAEELFLLLEEVDIKD